VPTARPSGSPAPVRPVERVGPLYAPIRNTMGHSPLAELCNSHRTDAKPPGCFRACDPLLFRGRDVHRLVHALQCKLLHSDGCLCLSAMGHTRASRRPLGRTRATRDGISNAWGLGLGSTDGPANRLWYRWYGAKPGSKLTRAGLLGLPSHDALHSIAGGFHNIRLRAGGRLPMGVA
jgi:hypothetical protein